MRNEVERGGFTLIDLLVVIAIIAVLSAYSIPRSRRRENSGLANSRLNNYYDSMGPGIRDNPMTPSRLFGRDLSWGVRDCLDGASNTIAISESLVGLANAANGYKANFTLGVANTTPDHNTISNAAMAPAAISLLFQNCMQSFNGGSSIRDDKGARWVSGRVGFTLFNTVAAPKHKNLSGAASCRIDCGGCSSDTSSVVPASSNLSGGVNAMSGDGSTKFVKDSVNLKIWWALGSKISGEAVSSDSY